MVFRNDFVCAAILSVLLLSVGSVSFAQHAELQQAPAVRLPGAVDSNSPAHWRDGRLAVFQSTGWPLISEGESQNGPLKARPVLINSNTHYPLWIEATWLDEDGTLYAWYHHEQWVCSSGLSTPTIGALVSKDNGRSFVDLGIVMESGYARDCGAQNGFFAGGHGDFTVLLDPWRQYFYFYFTNYGGPLDSQGVAVARLAFRDRASPAGRVWKFHRGGWGQPGLGGQVSAILPAQVSWSQADTDSFWGPSIHWNTFLNQYVMLLNRACCAPGWPAEGIYISYNTDLSNPYTWSEPEKLLDSDQARWYPQVIGLRPDGTDKLAGETARFYMGGDSRWRIIFSY